MIEITSLAQAFSVIAACWAIIAGIGAWKREFIGKRQIELSEQALAQFYEIKDAISFIRNPFSSENEGSTRKRDRYESETDAKLLDRGYIVIERYNNKENTFTSFYKYKYRYMATFGADTETIFNETFATVNSIFSSARMLATHYWRRQGQTAMDKDEFQRYLDEMYRHESIFWDSWEDDDDPIRQKLKAVQQKLENITRSCYREQSSLYSWLTKQWSNKT